MGPYSILNMYLSTLVTESPVMILKCIKNTHCRPSQLSKCIKEYYMKVFLFYSIQKKSNQQKLNLETLLKDGFQFVIEN